MLLNDNEYSLKTISEKTNITIENLEKLSQKDWSHFKKPQVNGLISIIEREFNEDLSELKAEANAYFKEHQNKEPECPIDLVDAATVGGSGSRILSNVITIVSLCAVGYAGWYYFVENQKKHPIDSNGTTYQEKSSGMFTDTINSAKRILGVGSESNMKANTTEEKREEPKEIKKEPIEKEVVQTNTEAPKSEAVTKESPKAEVNNSTENEVKKFDITTVSHESQPANEENKSEVVSKQVDTVQDNSTQSNTATESRESVNVVDSNTEASNGSVKGEVDNLLKELDANSSEEKAKSSEEKAESNEDNGTVVIAASETNSSDVNETENNNTEATVTEATINLKAKSLWIGIYNLTKNKRESKTIKKPFTLNVGDDKFAIVTGHNAFEIATDNGVKSFAKKGKVYFTIDKNGIETLDKKEYRKLTKRRAW